MTALDINPLLADDYGAVALDARMRVQKSCATHSDRPAIRPYPKELEEEIPFGKGSKLRPRPIRPEEAPALHKDFARLTPEEIRLRFLVPLKVLSHMMAARFPQIDHRIIDYYRRRGTRLVFGEVLQQNTIMLHLCKTLGFRQHSIPGEPDTVRVELGLG